MNIRERTEDLETIFLSTKAIKSKQSKGRLVSEEKCNIRTEFQRDRDRIIHSKSFRRLKHKTQVFIAPEGDHFRTRLTHTLEVSQIARTIGRALRLNEDLIEAISLGHDLGHTPFGHTGERVLNKLHPGGFKHNEQSLRVVDLLEDKKDRVGLNLTYEVREGIRNHSGDKPSETLESQTVKYADRIAYINHDIDDAIRAKVIKADDIDKDLVKILGETHGKRINTMILDLIENSLEKDEIKMSKEIGEATLKLRDFMFQNVYYNNYAKSEESKAEYIISELYKYYLNNSEKLPKEHTKIYKDSNHKLEDMICDYIAGMTDRYVINKFNKLFVPQSWSNY